jgi:hypothetical protein
MPLFLTLDRFKNHVFYEHKRMKELALFLTDVKKYNYIILQKLKTFYFIKFECIIVVCAFTLPFSLQNDILYCHSLYRVDTLTTSWPTLMHLENEYIIFQIKTERFYNI